MFRPTLAKLRKAHSESRIFKSCFNAFHTCPHFQENRKPPLGLQRVTNPKQYIINEIDLFRLKRG